MPIKDIEEIDENGEDKDEYSMNIIDRNSNIFIKNKNYIKNNLSKLKLIIKSYITNLRNNINIPVHLNATNLNIYNSLINFFNDYVGKPYVSRVFPKFEYIINNEKINSIFKINPLNNKKLLNKSLSIHEYSISSLTNDTRTDNDLDNLNFSTVSGYAENFNLDRNTNDIKSNSINSFNSNTTEIIDFIEIRNPHDTNIDISLYIEDTQSISNNNTLKNSSKSMKNAKKYLKSNKKNEYHKKLRKKGKV